MTASFRILAGLALASVSSHALAEDNFTPGDLTDEQASKRYVMDIGVAGFVNPKYDGADEYIIYPLPLIAFSRFYLPGFGQVKEGETQGVFIYPSFGFVGERNPSDSRSLDGTSRVPWAGEIGLGGGFRHDWFRAFIEVRHGFNGHRGFVGRAGIDVITEVTDRLTFVFGPRVDAADGSYMNTYFSVPAGGPSGPYTAEGGFKSVGGVVRASYALTDTIGLHLQGGYDRLIGEAADSPITQNDNMWSVGFGATYRFAWDMF
ncbi:Outer membrane scaffolding protein for murein synthesis, MipA/OmpV family [Pseudovibrio denitrificans]|uniref:Outer membrane scaffolding protein for murein synthesis, MipA/OmpV family n=1 Tax=Pseudovibrio denitrificans TaxID=258256 RepID=A0A1I7AID5_9HYPH|nr:MipA/OmpV family protein [Pseudovibrio denitrificans]SFT74605.1 Outer membrane scaffolding protein for murein synthesis, MipA/OmpV family [Pseudovibrio denitrificans]